jgi:uncharacterized protein (DUF1697 family)
MTVHVALLRAVNVGGTGKLPMAELKAMCEAQGWRGVRTYIASGNVVFDSRQGEAEIVAALQARLAAYAGKPVGVLVRTASEMAQIVARNPFKAAPGNSVVAVFLDRATSASDLLGVAGLGPDEEIGLGRREIYVRYGAGIAQSRLRIPAARDGTGRNMNTVAKLAILAAG